MVAGVEGVDAAVSQGQVARWWLGTVLLPCSSRQHRSSTCTTLSGQLLRLQITQSGT